MIIPRQIALLALAALLGSAGLASANEVERPNIVLIISDDHGWPYYGFARPDVQFIETSAGMLSVHEIAQTPNVDTLAAEGVLFRNGYTTASVCRPSLKTLLSGAGFHHQQWEARRTALEATPIGDIPSRLESQYFRTLPRELQRYGYLSWEGGKMWLGNFSDAGFTHGLAKKRHTSLFNIDGVSFMREGSTAATCGSTALQGSTCAALDPLRDFLDEAEAEGAPFFVWFAPALPHAPLDPPLPEYHEEVLATGIVHSADYFSRVRWLDEAVGELLAELEDRGLRENTLIVYLSDNGWGAGLQLWPGRGRGKSTAYAMGSRTPVIFSWPGRLEPADLPDLVSASDVPATILGFAGANDARPIPEQVGIDLRDRIHGGLPIARSEIVQQTPIAVLQPPWRYLVNTQTGLEELYRVDTDPLELIDLADSQPARVAEMRARAAEHRLALLEPPERTEIVGRIVAREDGAPIVAAQVRLGRREIASTDSGGYFVVGPQRPGVELLRPQKRVRSLRWAQGYPFTALPFSLGGLFLPMEGEPKSRPVEVAEGRMRGLVTDSETGAPVSGVRIRAKAKSPSSTPRTVTGPDGMWLLEGLPASTYRIGLSGRGYRKTVVRDVEVGTGDVLIDVPIALEPR